MLFAPNPPQRILQTFSVHSCHSALTSQHAGIIPSTVRSEPQAATQRFTILPRVARAELGLPFALTLTAFVSCESTYESGPLPNKVKGGFENDV